MDPKVLIAIIVICILIILVFLFVILPYICYRIAFYANRKHDDSLTLPDLDFYKGYNDIVIDYAKRASALPHKIVSIKSFDGLKLVGRYFEYEKGAPIELIFHGYKGNADRDLSAGVFRCFDLKHNALLVDQRASGRSEGRTISFGINESKDVLPWIEYIINNIDKDAQILIGGISMGASTVLMVADKELPSNVKGILADCGYTSPKDIINYFVKNMKLSPKLFYPFIKLGAKMYGKFDLDSASPIESLKNSKYPILFIHGDKDNYVPYEMSVTNYETCSSTKKLTTIKNAGHGLAYLVDKDEYVSAMENFFHF